MPLPLLTRLTAAIARARRVPARAFLLLLATTTLVPAAPRQTVGLALGGGGARGLAHIGVIQWFEEHHIPIDYVAGTSMGGLVGGAFATGRDAAGLHELVEGVDWTEALASSPPYSVLAFRRKEGFS